MKRTVLLHAEISFVISQMGHTDRLAIGDCGLPIPDGTRRIDLALRPGIPGFLDTLDAVLTELCIQEIILAEEIRTMSPDLHRHILSRLPDVPVTYMPHEAFKACTAHAKAVVRTGETTPYANIILVSGVAF